MPLRRTILAVCLAVGMPVLAAANTVGAGVDHTVVVKPDGSVWSWGDNTYAQLGDGTLTSRTVPGPVNTITDAVAVAVGGWHTLVLRSDGSVWAWGYNANGQLGDGTLTQRTEPVAVSGLSNVIAIAAGSEHSVALTSGGQVWTWGRNTNGQLGDGSTTRSSQPVLISVLTSMTAVGAGANHTLAVKSDGTVRSWGLNTNGQLGDSSTTQRTAPVTVSGVTGAIAAAGGTSHSLILKSDGTVRAMGLNTSGQIGDATNSQRTSSVAVNSITTVASIAAGSFSSYARKSDGTVWAWGHNGSGRLGDGTTTNRNAAVQVSALSGIGFLSAGTDFALAVSSSGVVSSWGVNGSGQLGDGSKAARSIPVAISGANYDWKVGIPVFSVAAGSYTAEKTVVISCGTPDATIHYTLDGTEPSESDASLVSGSSVHIDQSITLKARAYKTGSLHSDIAEATYSLGVAALAFSPGHGTYTSAQTVSISTSTPGVTIRYSIDGSMPSESSPVYTGPLSISTTTTLQAIGYRANWSPSALKSGTFTMNFATLVAPSFSPAPGTYTNDVALVLTAQTDATIRYVYAPQNVTGSSTAYSAPIALSGATTVNASGTTPTTRPALRLPLRTRSSSPPQACPTSAAATQPATSSRSRLKRTGPPFATRSMARTRLQAIQLYRPQASSSATSP